jgi:uncharacterized membrane protein YciS (DUF1049 family)
MQFMRLLHVSPQHIQQSNYLYAILEGEFQMAYRLLVFMSIIAGISRLFLLGAKDTLRWAKRESIFQSGVIVDLLLWTGCNITLEGSRAVVVPFTYLVVNGTFFLSTLNSILLCHNEQGFNL